MTPPFRRVLVANRGEIALRIVRACHEMGMEAVAVYSDADRTAAHVRTADAAVWIGPAPAAESYLRADAIVEAALATGAEAVHPGYGFLAERASFAQAVEDAGLVFVGPPPAVIAALGDKLAARRSATAAGVPVVPGTLEPAPVDRPDQVAAMAAEAERIGFPLLVKAAAGGGGRGMRRVEAPDELAAALISGSREAASAFGDGSVYIERVVFPARHIEVQLLGDAFGTVVALGERDCSVQRRHQKLIEEAPAPAIPPQVRAGLHAAGLAVARAVGYVNAGTVEFLYQDGEFWFMEMNTRLQVEHCVTEEVCGLDLVEWQLRIAAGEALPYAQAALEPRGHAVEVRICAEDPLHGFVPSAGRLSEVHWPAATANLRTDAGFERGDEVPTHYDSLLAKVIGHGASREEAIASLERGLGQLRIAGVATNAAWLAGAIATPAFRAANLSTRFVEEQGAALAGPEEASAADYATAALGYILGLDRRAAPAPTQVALSPWAARDAFRLGLPARQLLQLRAGAVEQRVAVTREGALWRVAVAGEEQLYAVAVGEGALMVTVAGASALVPCHLEAERLSLWRGARRIDFALVDPRVVEARASVHAGELVARLPGTVVAVAVAPGEVVAAGATLLVLEAMKMEHAVLAPHAGRVVRVLYRPGERVTEGALLVELAEEPPPPGEAGGS
jgi:3-methylcrotonyl-CoA carboxylase alpha subunit